MNDMNWTKLMVDSGDIRVISPCLSLELFLDDVDEEGVLDFYERSREVLGDLFGYFSTGSGSMKKVTARALGIVPSWKGKMNKPEAGLFIVFSSLEKGAGEGELKISLSRVPNLSREPVAGARILKHFRAIRDGGGRVFHATSQLRLSIPVMHPITQHPSQMLAWVHGLKLVREGLFVSGTCGYSLTSERSQAGFGIEQTLTQRLPAIHGQYPGLDVPFSGGAMSLVYYQRHPERFLHRVKRTNWLTLLSGNCVEQLGGTGDLQTKLGAGPAVLHRLANGAVLLQAGSTPEPGDRSQREPLPGWYQVARAIRPVRIEALVRELEFHEGDWVQEWIEAFDREAI